MAVEQKVVIRVEIDPDMTKAAAVNAFLSTLDKRLGKTNKSLQQTTDLLKAGMAYHLAEVAKKMAAFGKAILKVNFKGLVVELALVTAGLVAMKGALAAGRGIMNGWANTVSFLKVTTAGFTAGIVALVSALMAANRQFQQTQLSPFIGGMQNAREAMSALRGDSLGLMGPQGISGAVATLTRAGADTRRLTPMLKQIGNISSGDPKAFQALTQAVAAVQSTGKTKAGAEALKGLGPMFEGVAGKAGAMSADEFMKAMASGDLTPTAFKGQMDKMGTTLMGGFKGMITKFYVALADMGGVFLDPLRNALAQIEHILLRSLFRVSTTIQSFGLETFIPKLISGVERFSNWWVKLIVNDLPRLLEVYGNIAEWWRDFSSGTGKWFTRLGAGMDKFKTSGEAAWKFWKNIFREIGDFMGGRFQEYDKDITKNLEQFQHFGTTFGRVIAGLLGVVTAFKDEFMGMLPELNSFFDFLTMDVFPVMQDFAVQFAKAFKSALPVIRNIASAFLPMLNALNKLIGAIGGSSGLGGLAVLVAGWLTMTKGGQDSMQYMRGGYLGDVAPRGRGSLSHRLGASVGNRFRAGRGAMAAGAGMAGTGGAFFATGAGVSAARFPVLGGGLHGPVDPRLTQSQALRQRWGNRMKNMGSARAGFGMSKGMGMGPMMGMMMGGQLLGSMVGGDAGGAISSAGSYAAMGSMLGPGGALLGAGLGFGKAALDARTGKGGALAGAASGAALGGMLGGPIGAGIGAALGGAIGWWKGNKNAEKLAKAGEDLAKETVDAIVDGFKSKSREGINKDRQDLVDLINDEVRMKDMAKQKGVSYEAFDSEMRLQQIALEESVPGIFANIDSSVNKLAEITGHAADDIEANAARWGIALQGGQQAIDDYVKKANEAFKDHTEANVASIIDGVVYDTFMNSPLDVQNRKDRARDESRAAMNNLFADMQATGKVDPDLMAGMKSAAMAEGSALGLTGGALTQWVDAGIRGLPELARRGGYSIDSGAMNELTGQWGEGGFYGAAFENFKDTNYYAQNLTQMSGRMGMSETELETTIKDMFHAVDAEAQMAIFNERLHSEAADALVEYKNQVVLSTEALAEFRARLLGGGGFTNTYRPGPGSLNDRWERGVGVTDEELVDYESWLSAQ